MKGGGQLRSEPPAALPPFLARRRAMPLRYAILHHTGVPDPHYDLMFETYPGSDLSTWRSRVWPIVRPTTLVRIKAHRREYLDFEGEVSQRRGRVDRMAGGTCAVEVGPAEHWTIRLLTGTPPLTLHLSPAVDDRWEASVDGGANGDG
jgi:hypothetical protein